MPLNVVLRNRRKALGLTQEQIALRLGVSTPAVSKWETGTSCPDITLLPILARLLQTDLNTLLCFHTELSEQEIGIFCNELVEQVQKDGLAAGFALAKEKIREYPNCGLLIHTVAATMDGSLMMSGLTPDEKEPYQELLLSWYEAAAQSDDPKAQNLAVYMLASRYMNRGDYEKAQEMLDLLPQWDAPDKRLLQASLYAQQGKTDEAAVLMERRLMQAVNDVQNCLMQLTTVELEDGKRQQAERIAEISGKAADLFDQWSYSKDVASLQIALSSQDVDKSLSLIDSLLQALFLPFDSKDSPLYYRIAKNRNTAAAGQKLLPGLLAELENSPDYDFLRSHKKFQELLDRYRARLTADA